MFCSDSAAPCIIGKLSRRGRPAIAHGCTIRREPRYSTPRNGRLPKESIF